MPTSTLERQRIRQRIRSRREAAARRRRRRLAQMKRNHMARIRKAPKKPKTVHYRRGVRIERRKTLWQRFKGLIRQIIGKKGG